MSLKEPWEFALMGDVEALRESLIDGADVNACDEFGRTALYLTCASKNPRRYEIVRSLIASDCDVNRPNLFGDTPLKRAIGWGNLACAALLIQANCDIHAEVHFTQKHLCKI